MINKNSVLIVDDSSSNIMELYHILRDEYDVLTAMDAASALKTTDKFLPDLILLDIVMPGMSGFDLLNELKKSEKTKYIPVIFITGLSEEGNERKGLAIGAVDFIRKPFSEAVVRLRVRQQIEIINLKRDEVTAKSTDEPTN